MGRIALMGGDLEAADRHLRRSAVIFQGRAAKLETGRTAYWNALLSLAQHEPEKASQELDKAQQIFEQLGAAADLGQVEQQLARITGGS
jgi:CRISPR/Cas system-associated protein Csm6